MSRFLIHGARGNRPVSGATIVRHGGETTCLSLETDKGLVIIDAGTGLAGVVDTYGAKRHERIALLFTHFHLDHLMGLPSLRELCGKGTEMTVLASQAAERGDWRQSLDAFLGESYWPVALAATGADLRFTDIVDHADGLERLGVTVTCFSVPHPQGCLAYRLVTPDISVVVATDTEYTEESLDARFVDFCSSADFLVLDAQYTPDEYPSHRGWGHSTWRTAVEIARRSAVGTLVLTHHSPSRTDAELDAIVERSRLHFATTIAASSGLELAMPGVT